MTEYINIAINNVGHSLYVSGENLENPILLCVHGGPGQAETAYISNYQKALEKHIGKSHKKYKAKNKKITRKSTLIYNKSAVKPALV